MMADTASMFRDQLAPGERLLWSGLPKQGLMLRRSDAIIIPFSLWWGVWALTPLSGLLRSGDGAVDKVFGIELALFTLYLVAGRFFVDAWLRRRSYYAVTDRRAMTLGGVFAGSLRTLVIQPKTRILLTEHADGSGTILVMPTVLGTSLPWSTNPLELWYWDFGFTIRGFMPLLGFCQIDGARSVFNLLVGLQAAASRDIERGLGGTPK